VCSVRFNGDAMASEVCMEGWLAGYTGGERVSEVQMAEVGGCLLDREETATVSLAWEGGRLAGCRTHALASVHNVA